MCAVECVDAPIGHAIPDLERAVLRRRGELSTVRRPFDASHCFAVLILWLGRHEASACFDVVETRDGVLSANREPIAARMKVETTYLIDFGDRTEGFLRGGFGVFEELDGVIT